MKKYILILLLAFLLTACEKKIDQNNLTNSENKENQQTETPKLETTPLTLDNEKIIPNENMCAQISKEFVNEVTGINIVRVGTINDYAITACDFYLSDEKNSPYIVIVLNKNLSVEKQKQIAEKSKMILKTDSSISGNHYIAWADNETRISNINLVIDENNFIRIDKNVERAIDNEGLIKLASAVSKRL